MTARRPTLGLDMLEAEWQGQFLDLAHALSWEHLHVRRSIGKGRSWQTTTNLKGWPDLLLWSARQPGRHIGVELKREAGVVSPEQLEVGERLVAAGFEFYVWRPSDLAVAQAVLTRPPTAT